MRRTSWSECQFATLLWPNHATIAYGIQHRAGLGERRLPTATQITSGPALGFHRQTNYDYNRAAFRSVCDTAGIHPLATAYAGCVLLELSLKQYLAANAVPANDSHDLPTLIQCVGRRNARYLALCNALQRQLSDTLRSLYSQGKDGLPCPVPSRSYPYIRYIRHASDWPSPCNSDAEIRILNSLIARLRHLFKTHTWE